MSNLTATIDRDRIEREREFHDERYAHNPGRSSLLGRMTGELTLDALAACYRAVTPFCPNAAILDYGCSQGFGTFMLKGRGAAHVTGIDLSPVAVQQARAAADRDGVDGVSFLEMNAESLTFAPASFDVVFGIGILHHLDLNTACREIVRVLKPTGVAVFLEPLRHNPAINLVRWLTPQARTADEHPLSMGDVRQIANHFDSCRLEFVNLTTLLSAPFAGLPGSRLAFRSLRQVDRWIFAGIPPLRRWSWNVVLTLQHPRPAN